MNTRIAYLWDGFRSSLWFVPTILSLAVALLAPLAVRVDIELHGWLPEHVPWLVMTPSSAQATLSAIAGAMVTSTSLVFSITIVAVSIAASQFGSRLIRTFRNNRVTHWTLGAFVATSLYCLMLLVVVREGEDAQFVPHVAVYLAMLAALGCMGLLIFFIHNTAVSVQAPNIVRASAKDLDDSIERLYPSKLGEPPENAGDDRALREQYENLGEDCHVVCSTREGYVQAIDFEAVMSLACESEVVIELLARPGTFLTENLPLAKFWLCSEPDEETGEHLSQAFITGSVRTPRQDAKYAVNEVVEVAVRALSPGINDPFTAITCVDRLGAAIGRLAVKRIPSAFRQDDEGQLRVVAWPVTFSEMLDAAFNQIRQNARTNVGVFIRLLTALEAIAVQLNRQADREAVRRHAEMTRRGAEEAVPEANDRRAVERQFERVMEVLQRRLDKEEDVKQNDEAAEQAEDHPSEAEADHGVPTSSS